MTQTQVPMQVLVKQADGRYGLQPASSADAFPSSSLQQMGKASGPKMEEEKTFLASPPGDAQYSGSWLKTSPQLGEGSSPHGNFPNTSILQSGKLSPRRSFVLAPAEQVVPEQRPGAEMFAGGETEELRNKLLALGSTFTSLDKQVEEDARKRRGWEEKRSQELLTLLASLEQALSDEASNRELGYIAVRQAVEHRMSAMVQHLQGKLSERFAHLSKSVEMLSERCSTVERGIQQLKGEVPSKLQLETAALKQTILDMLSELAAETQRTSEQDDEVLARLEEGQRNVDSQLQKELAQLERRGEALQELIDQISFSRVDSETETSRAGIQNSFVEINEAIAHEVSRREAADDKVVQAINEYTSTLHRSLTVANA
eukprot:TRINITY_DN20522_c0_g1_i1.p1 TRINITY_DN20522_c0_g1~~TRINITY_DN20522_c0_g1_i1.p1  ORF type:complete len:373 (-),score=91.25 TRINITY_DN20522_c0_g1_i1:52-1170(-)